MAAPGSTGGKRCLERRDFLLQSLAGLAGVFFCEAASFTSALAESQVKETSLALPDPAWVRKAILALWKDRARTGVTPLLEIVPPFDSRLRLYLKNEGQSPTGSLKHRVAWGLIMQALVNGEIGPHTSLYEATSGNTGIGEAYFAKLLGLPYTAVMGAGISPLKMQAIRHYGGKTAIAPRGLSSHVYVEELVVKDPHGYNLNQFANAEKSLDFFDAPPARTMNMAAEIYRQLEGGGSPCPSWFVAGAGSGGTATSLARYLRKWADNAGHACPARLAVVDPEDSALFAWYQTNDSQITSAKPSRIEGIGSSGPVVFGQTFSLLRTGVARMYKVPDDASLAAMHLTAEITGFQPGPSTGANLVGALRLLQEMHQAQEPGAVVTIICDDGERYQDTYYSAPWLKSQGLDPDKWRPALDKFWNQGQWTEACWSGLGAGGGPLGRVAVS
ncbi:MAG: pyridoxal-phosphate dependent enzyme [Deltaproteobacteria bacterium]|nr:pyridoxal-phosphate dependent enzyme [Deltaproteobacteria bacterium]